MDNYLRGYMAGYMRKLAADDKSGVNPYLVGAAAAGGGAASVGGIMAQEGDFAQWFDKAKIAKGLKSAGTIGRRAAPILGAVAGTVVANPLIDTVLAPADILSKGLHDPDMDTQIGAVDYKNPYSASTMAGNVAKHGENVLERPMGIGTAIKGVFDPVGLAVGGVKGIYGTGKALANAYWPHKQDTPVRPNYPQTMIAKNEEQ